MMFEKLALAYLQRRGYVVLKGATFTTSGDWIKPAGVWCASVLVTPGEGGAGKYEYEKAPEASPEGS
jgi:hypothetical protein